MKKIYSLCAAILLSATLVNAQDECTPHAQVSNAIENGSFVEAAGAQVVANDFAISPNLSNFSANQIIVNLLSQGGIASADIYFLDDMEGAPGAVIDAYTITGAVPTSQEINGANFGYDLHEVVFDLATPLDFAGGATYWLQVAPTPITDGTQIAWETTTVNPMGSFLYFDNAQTTEWTMGTADGVFTISGECTAAEGCLVPENLTVSMESSSSATVSWTQFGDNTEWEVEYGEAGFALGSGTTVSVSGTPSTTISDFVSPLTYDFYVKSVCEGEDSESAGPVSVTFDYCEVTVTQDVEPITHVEIAGISNTSDVNSTVGHEFFLDQIATLVPGNTHPIAIEGYTGGDWETAVVVFIDWNGDLDFNNTDERYEIGILANSTGTDGIQLTGEITVPADAPLGMTRMRVVKQFDAFTTSGCASVDWGAAEDYSVNVDLESSVNFSDYDFRMGPNPTKDFVQINSTENIQSIKVYNLLGQQVLNNQTNVQSPQVDLTSLQNGVYLMEITIKDNKEVFKIVKQ